MAKGLGSVKEQEQEGAQVAARAHSQAPAMEEHEVLALVLGLRAKQVMEAVLGQVMGLGRALVKVLEAEEREALPALCSLLDPLLRSLGHLKDLNMASE